MHCVPFPLPLPFHRYEPCGCGEFSTNGNYNWDNDPSDDNAWWSGADNMFGDDQVSSSNNDWWEGADSFSSAGAKIRRWHGIYLFLVVLASSFAAVFDLS